LPVQREERMVGQPVDCEPQKSVVHLDWPVGAEGISHEVCRVLTAN
jgi:hypothetical protein